MTESRERLPGAFICSIHEIETIRSCPLCLEKIRADMEALRQIPYRLKARRPGALYPAKRLRRVST